MRLRVVGGCGATERPARAALSVKYSGPSASHLAPTLTYVYVSMEFGDIIFTPDIGHNFRI